jgi:DNA-binding MarR family transcriptional regulator
MKVEPGIERPGIERLAIETRGPARAEVSGLKAHLGFWLRFVSNHVSQRFAAKVAACGVTVAEWVVMREMFDADVTSPSALAAGTGLSRGAVSKLIERLREKKLLTRAESAEDRRYQDVSLTAAGLALVPVLAALADSNDEECFSQLSHEEREQLLATLRKLVEADKLNIMPIE